MIINNILKKIVNIKIENLLSAVYIPYMIINTGKSDASLIVSALMIHLMLLIGVYIGISDIRADIKEYIYQLKPIKINIIDLQAIKKEIFTKAFNNKPTTAIIKLKTFLNNSIH